MDDWKEKHGEIIDKFLHFLNDRTDRYILKGGSALIECYGLGRFSEDIDFDSQTKNPIKNAVDAFCKENDFEYRIAKDTPSVTRFLIQYGNEEKPLKVEVSHRNREINPENITDVDGIKVYTIDKLASMKRDAYLDRDKIRDLNDIVYICKNYDDKLSNNTKDSIADAIERKGIEQFDYLSATQSDDNIDKNQLSDDFLELWDRYGLIDDEEDNDDDDLDDFCGGDEVC